MQGILFILLFLILSTELILLFSLCFGQFYDHFFEWNLTHISNLIAIRSKNGIKPTSSLRILAADPDRYIAAIDEKVIAKIGPSDDVGNLIPSNFKLVLSGEHYAVWEKQA